METFGLPKPQLTSKQTRRPIVSAVPGGFARRPRGPFVFCEPVVSCQKFIREETRQTKPAGRAPCPRGRGGRVASGRAQPSSGRGGRARPGEARGAAGTVGFPRPCRSWAALRAFRPRAAPRGAASAPAPARPPPRASAPHACGLSVCLCTGRVSALYTYEWPIFFLGSQEPISIPLQAAGVIPPGLRMF